ncbi:putative Insecticidal toxin complex protein TccB2 [Aspergillus udagawae]|uniref:Insecticidal toxin complex protein TccB2 n=1 Tax=Aspergillus udagawae TaxID=91492 RepID=A0A8E0QTX0_9EURO|nr:putative Insecticidal toxin complex protein TccB2 [Aspergillus udagawae]GIC88956.1 putative Insecticidal toxin complex protein TccB2 [Aspergillus udagawae]
MPHHDAAGAADTGLEGIGAVTPAVCGWFLEQLTPSKPNYLMEQLIEVLFPRAGLDRLIDPKSTPESTSASKAQSPKDLSAAVLSRLRLGVFKAEPLRSINRLIAQGKFVKSLQSDATAVRDILSTMTEEALEIGSPDLLARVAIRIDTTQQELSDALVAVQSLQALVRIAEDPEDVPIIYGKRYRTIRVITQADKDSWIAQMVKEGISKDNALKAYDFAERIDC